MACSGRNILINGGFQKGRAPWTGKRIRRMKNPLRAGDYSMWMGATGAGGDSVLKQTIRGPFERGCAYYLYFRLLNVTPPQSKAELYATVAYLNEKRQIIRSTPLLIHPPYLGRKWYSYFTIVPSPLPMPGMLRWCSCLKKACCLWITSVWLRMTFDGKVS